MTARYANGQAGVLILESRIPALTEAVRSGRSNLESAKRADFLAGNDFTFKLPRPFDYYEPYAEKPPVIVNDTFKYFGLTNS